MTENIYFSEPLLGKVLGGGIARFPLLKLPSLSCSYVIFLTNSVFFKKIVFKEIVMLPHDAHMKFQIHAFLLEFEASKDSVSFD